MRALVVTNMYPTADRPYAGTFVAGQVDSLRQIGVDVDLWHIDRELGRRAYRGLAQQARHRVEAGRPDIVHIQYGGVIADEVTKAIHDRPVLVSFCGDDLLGGEGGGIVDRAARRYGVFASRRAAARAAGIVVKSRNLFDALPRTIDRARVWTLPNGVDVSLFRPIDSVECRARLGWDQARRHVLFPAPPTRAEKRYWLAEAAVSRVEGEVDLHALGSVAHADVPIWMNAADAVILTSTHEGSPNAIKEALACNVPVVSVDVGDVAERIAGIDGCYIAAPTPADLADKLSHVLARRGRIDAQEQVSAIALDRVAERLYGIYETLIG